MEKEKLNTQGNIYFYNYEITYNVSKKSSDNIPKFNWTFKNSKNVKKFIIFISKKSKKRL